MQSLCGYWSKYIKMIQNDFSWWHHAFHIAVLLYWRRRESGNVGQQWLHKYTSHSSGCPDAIFSQPCWQRSLQNRHFAGTLHFVPRPGKFVKCNGMTCIRMVQHIALERLQLRLSEWKEVISLWYVLNDCFWWWWRWEGGNHCVFMARYIVPGRDYAYHVATRELGRIYFPYLPMLIFQLSSPVLFLIRWNSLGIRFICREDVPFKKCWPVCPWAPMSCMDFGSIIATLCFPAEVTADVVSQTTKEFKLIKAGPSCSKVYHHIHISVG